MSEPCGVKSPTAPMAPWWPHRFSCEATKGHTGDHSTMPTHGYGEIRVEWPNDGSDQYVRQPDEPCAHANNWMKGDITHLSDTGKTQGELTMGCSDCGDSFLFPEALVVGISLSGITRSLDRRELRVALTPESQVMP